MSRSGITNAMRFQKVLINSTTGFVEVNLTKNTIIGEIVFVRGKKERMIVDTSELGEDFSFDEYRAWWAQKYLVSDKEEYLKKSNVRYLLSQFRTGNEVVDIECSNINYMQEREDTKQTYYMSEDDETGDVTALCLNYNISEEVNARNILKEQQSQSLISGLYDDFEFICLVELDEDPFKDKVVDYRKCDMLARNIPGWNEEKVFFKKLIMLTNCIPEKEARDEFCAAVDRPRIVEVLRTQGFCYVDFQAKFDGVTNYYQLKFISVKDESGDINSYVVGFRNIESIKRLELEKNEELSKVNMLRMLADLASDYLSIWFINPETGEYEMHNINKSFADFLNDGINHTNNFLIDIRKIVEKHVYESDKQMLLDMLIGDTLVRRLRKENAVTLEIRIKRDDNLFWYRSKIVMSSRIGGKRQIVVGIVNIDKERQEDKKRVESLEIISEQKNELERQQKELENVNIDLMNSLYEAEVFKNVVMADACGFFKVDLTADRVLSGIYEFVNLKQTTVSDFLPAGINMQYTEFLKFVTKVNVISDINKFKRTMSLDNLARCYGEGNLNPSVTCWVIDSMGTKRAHSHSIFLSMDKISGHIMAYCIVQDVSKEREDEEKNKRNVNNIIHLTDSFEAIYNVNMHNGSFELYMDNSEYKADLEKSNERKDFFTSFERVIEKIVYEEDLGKIKRLFDRYELLENLKSNKELVMEYRVKKDGDLVWYRVKIAKAIEAGTIHAIIGIFNVNDQIVEEKKKRLQLESAKRTAELANEAKSTFLFNMSHDIRTPMNAITGYTSMAKKNMENTELVKGYLEKIDVSGQQLLSLVNQVLDMSRIESGKVSIQEEKANIIEHASSMMAVASANANVKGVTLNFEMKNIIHKDVIMDKGRVNQIIVNILGNAVKYTPKGGTIIYTIREIDEGNDDSSVYEFRVADNGIGMSKSYLKHIFEDFSRENNTTVSGIQGTGLGMSIVKKLADLMNGSIDIRSEKGVGTEVCVKLPLKHVTANGESDIRTNEANVGNVLQGKRILLVEDNEMNMEISTFILSEIGAQVEEANDGDVAVQKVREAEAGYYDFVIMDIQMPRMNGYDASKAIRRLKDKNKAKVPIIAMTANAFDEDKKRAIDAGMDAHLAKPIEPDKLIETLRNMYKE